MTPPGLTSNNPTSRHALNVWATSVFGSTKSNEFRLAWSHLSSRDDAESALSFEIPSIEIVELGMTGSLEDEDPHGDWAASNLPNFRYGDLYQLQDTFTHVHRIMCSRPVSTFALNTSKASHSQLFAGCFGIRR